MLSLRPCLRRALCATTALAFALPAYAQTVDSGAPPARVGQIAGIQGSVSFNGAGSNGAWVAAQNNYPLTAGDTLYTQTNAQAAVALDSSRLFLAPSSELQVTSLDDQNFGATVAQGEVFLNLTALAPGQSFVLNTPGGTVSLQTSGQYDIIAGPTTTVAVLSGQAAAGNVTVGAGQAAALTQGQAQVAQLQEDEFVRHVLGELAPPPPPYVPPVVNQMTGAAELSSYGSWDQDPDYGAVWYPQVGADWAPYREGSWTYIAPWGWTWVEAEPWGFAPFHYGRWIHHEDRWGWVPAADRDEAAGYTPVYAPAVVTFFGLAAGAAITASLLSGGHVGWVPLAPGEAYHPPYHANDGYIQRINRIDISRTTNINERVTTINNYANRGGATYVPAAAMARGERINRAGGGAIPPGEMEHARPAEGMINSAIRPNVTQRPAQAPQMRPGSPAIHPGTPENRGMAPGNQRPAGAMEARPGNPETRGTQAPARPETQRPEAIRPPMQNAQPVRPEQARPLEAPRAQESRPAPQRPAEMPRMITPHVEAPRMQAPPARIEAPRPEAPRAPRAEAPPAPRAEGPPAPRAESPRAEAPRPEAPRPEMARPEMTRPAPAPRPAPGRPPEQGNDHRSPG
jgi:hypothetical protein